MEAPEQTTRRDVLRAFAGIGAATSTAGCQGLFGSGSDAEWTPSPEPPTETATPSLGDLSDRSISGTVPQYQYNVAKTGFHPGTPPEKPLRVAWNWDHGAVGGTVGFQPVISNGMVFFGTVSPNIENQTVFYALDAVTGTEQWHQRVDRYRGGVAVGEKRLYYLDAGNVVAKTLAGRPLWTFTLSERLQGTLLALDEDTIYAGDVNIYAIDRFTGALKWRATGLQRSDGTALAVADGRVYTPRFDGYTYAIDAATGDPLWWYRPPVLTEGRTPAVPRQVMPAVSDGVVYGGSTDGRLYALDAATGDQLWLTTVQHALSGSIAIADDLVVANDDEGVVYGVDASDGTERWRRDTGDSLDFAPIIVGDTVCAFGFDRIWAFARDGTPTWSAPMVGYPAGASVALDGFVFIPTRKGMVCLR